MKLINPVHYASIKLGPESGDSFMVGRDSHVPPSSFSAGQAVRPYLILKFININIPLNPGYHSNMPNLLGR